MSWWHGTSIYQVYPRSFADSDGDGIGDLPGIIGKLDYIRSLGVETIWVSPFFASPQEDFGYDVTDFQQVAPEYGTLADAERLIAEAHARGMRIMFDLVLNHTSDQHPWFLRSRGSRHNPKADWYIWRDGKGSDGRQPPTNWKAANELNSAWQWSPQRQQFYLATFLPFQPDLNWRNPQVRSTMFDVVRFWLDRGVDGFRLDIFGMIMKDPTFPDNPFRPRMTGGFPRMIEHRHTENRADNVELGRQLRAICQEYPGDRILLGEVFGPPEVLRRFLGEDDDGLNLVFLFDFLTYSYDATWFTQTIRRFEESFPAPRQPTYVLENHDRSRTLDRVGGDLAKARVLAVLLLTLRGVPTVYMGQEIGMGNTRLPHRDALDPIASGVLRHIPGFILDRFPERINRDEMRTPMQWTAEPNAGFCPDDVRPWLPANPDHGAANVAAQTDDPESMLSLYRRLFALRAEHEQVRSGSLDLIPDLPDGVVAYRRGTLVVIAKLNRGSVTVPVTGVPLLAVGGVRVEESGVELDADSAVVLQT